MEQIDIIGKSSEEKLKIIENLKDDVVLIDEENVYTILLKEKIVVEEITSQYDGIEHYRYELDELIKDFKEDSVRV